MRIRAELLFNVLEFLGVHKLKTFCWPRCYPLVSLLNRKHDWLEHELWLWPGIKLSFQDNEIWFEKTYKPWWLFNRWEIDGKWLYSFETKLIINVPENCVHSYVKYSQDMDMCSKCGATRGVNEKERDERLAEYMRREEEELAHEPTRDLFLQYPDFAKRSLTRQSLIKLGLYED